MHTENGNTKNDGEHSDSLYIPHIDGLRALAVIIVILFHLSPGVFSGGYLGVDIFFVISGFVITKSLFKEYLQNSKINILNFYVRRLKRLYPALLLMVTVTTLLYIFVGFVWDTNIYLKSAASSILAVSNLYFLFTGDNYFHQDLVNPLIHTWSLGIEEQFYLIYPAFLVITLFVVKKLGLKLVTLASFILGLSVIMYVFFILNQNNVLGDFYFPLARFWELGFGCALFFFSSKFFFKKFTNIALWGAFSVVVFIQIFQGSINNLFLETLLITISSALLIYGGIENRGILRNFFASNMMTYLGRLSYSLYLWHLPTIYFLGLYLDRFYFLILAPIISLLAAMLSYHFFEKPIRYSKKLEKPILYSIKMVPLFILFLIILVSSVGLSKTRLFINNSFNYAGYQIKAINFIEKNSNLGERIQSKFTVDGHQILSCSDFDITFEVNDQGLRKECLKKVDNKVLFYLTGDSHALHFASAFDNSSIVENLYFVEIPRQSIVKEDSKDFDQNWSDFVLKEQEDELKRIHNDFDEIYYVSSFFLSKWQDQDEIIKKNLETYINTLGKYAHLIFIAPTPVFPAGPESCVLNGTRCSISKEQDLERRKAIFLLLKDFETRYENVSIYDPYEAICPNDECLNYDKESDTLIYMDKDHISPEFSKKLSIDLDLWLKQTFNLTSRAGS